MRRMFSRAARWALSESSMPVTRQLSSLAHRRVPRVPLTNRAASLGVQLVFPQGLAQELAGRCTGPGGARQLRRLVQTQVEDKLAAYLLRSGRKPVKIRLRIEEGEVVLT